MNFKGVFFKKEKSSDIKTVAIAGNPNVGKSTVFNALTGMHQHTGNWPGKTVSNASGTMKIKGKLYNVVDIPGTYSLNAQSAEEEVARDYLLSNNADAVLVVCDSTCIEKNLSFVLQIMECTGRVMVCVNLLDEAKKKGISIDIKRLSELLGVSVIGITAHKKDSIERLKNFISSNLEDSISKPISPIYYGEVLEKEIATIEKHFKKSEVNKRFLALKVLEGENDVNKYTSISYKELIESVKMSLEIRGENLESARKKISEARVRKAQEIAEQCVNTHKSRKNNRDEFLDKIFTGRFTGVPIMLLMVALIFWITIEGANYISGYLSQLSFFLEDKFNNGLSQLNIPIFLKDAVVYGGFRVLGWVVSVMLPPMAIFFPFFTILEDSGYLARIAYNLDKPFYKCNACGKQALTMCMGFGCNAVGVTGARIIDSPRERLLAVLTNSFMPCNGRFPMLITFITIFFVGVNNASHQKSALAALILSFVIIFAVLLSFGITKLLSATVLKGVPSSFILELPSYRKPQFAKVIIRSIFDRTLFVLGRAVAVAIPAGIVIWVLSNIVISGESILKITSEFLNPFASLLGLDGVILLAFILGTPANEIVIPLMLMMYQNESKLIEAADYNALENIFISNGWSIKTAVCVIVFAVFHWPCATTLISIKRETGSIKWTIYSFIIPTALGILLCILMNFLLKIFI